MAVSNIALYNEILRVLIEDPDDGAAEPLSALYTRASVQDALNRTLREMTFLTQLKAENTYESPCASENKSVQAPPTASTLLQVSFKDAQDVWNVIPSGSTVEINALMGAEDTSVAVPSVYVVDAAPNLMISLIPPPNADSEVKYTYVAQPTAVATPPTTADLDCPDDATPFVKYGALGLIFGQSGETYDPLRAEICNQLYDLGIEVLKARVTGVNDGRI